MSAWITRRATASDRDGAVALLERAHAGDAANPAGPQAWDWLYLRNPANAGLHYLVADAGTRLAGQYATLPVRLQLEGRERPALISLNTATDPAFQRQGIFTKLAEQLYSEATPDFALVYGFPNERSSHGLFDRLDWTNLGRVPLVARLLRTPPQLRAVSGAVAPLLGLLAVRDAAFSKKTASLRVEPLSSFGAWTDRLWQANAAELGVCVIRDAAFLQWRFVDAPRTYLRWALMHAAKPDPVGFAVSAVRDWNDTSVVWLMELQVQPNVRLGADSLLAAVLEDARHRGALAVCCVRTARAPYRGALARAGFVPLPRGSAPKLVLGVRALGEAGTTAFSAKAWYLSGADFDWL
jgi:GNAT superfamily N-acetyltransferase